MLRLLIVLALTTAAVAEPETEVRYSISDRRKLSGSLEITTRIDGGRTFESVSRREVFELWSFPDWKRSEVVQENAWVVESEGGRPVAWTAVSKQGDGSRCVIAADFPGEGPLVAGFEFSAFARAAALPAGPVRFLMGGATDVRNARIVESGEGFFRHGAESRRARHVRIEFEAMWADVWLSGTEPVLVRMSNSGREALNEVWAGWRLVECPDGVVESDASVPSGDITLAGTFTRPAGDGPFPAVVILSGSGADGRDGIAAGHPFLNRIAWELARAGIASVRLDDRGVGESGGDFSQITLGLLAADARAAADWLRERKEISKVGYLGHSEGAIVGPLAAAGDARAAAVFRLAGPALPLDAVLQEQALMHNELGYMGIEVYEEDCKLHARIRREDVDDLETNGVKLHVAWLRSHLKHDPLAQTLALKCPVEVFQGLADKNVLPYHADRIEKAMRTAGRAGFSVRMFEGLDHTFMKEDKPIGAPSRGLDEGFLRELAATVARRLR